MTLRTTLLLPLAALAPGAVAQLPCLDETAILSGPAAAGAYETVATDGDTVLAGLPGYADHGAVDVFVRGGGTWVHQARLEPPPGWEFDEQFGVSLAISGDTAVIGAWQGNWNWYGPQGAAYVFDRSGGTWSFTQTLPASSIAEFSFFGASVAIDGDTAVVGADFRQAVFVYTRSGGVWTERAVINTPGAAGGWFGNRAALEYDAAGSTLVVGAQLQDHVSPPADDSGAVYVYTGNGASWTLEQTLTGPATTLLNRRFGSDVDLEGDTLVIGAENEMQSGMRPGAVYVYTRSAGTWTQSLRAIGPNGQHQDDFGWSVGLAGDLAIVGAPGEDHGGNSQAGALYALRRSAGTWSGPLPLATSSGPDQHEYLGYAADAADDVYVAGQWLTPQLDARVFEPKPLVGTPFCTCAAGPCNNDDPRAGCANSTGAGATVVARGTPAQSDVGLFAEELPVGRFGIFFQGGTTAQLPFGDGLLCANAPIVRLTPTPLQADADGRAAFGPCAGTADLAAAGGVAPGSGVSRHYQFWYRDPTGPCGGGFNTTNGWSIVW